MFRDVYKSANNDISPDEKLLDNILNTKTKKTYNNYYKLAPLAAACFILIGTLAIYPKINSNITPNQKQAVITEDVVKTEINEDVLVSTLEPVKTENDTKLKVITKKPEAVKPKKQTSAPVKEEIKPDFSDAQATPTPVENQAMTASELSEQETDAVAITEEISAEETPIALAIADATPEIAAFSDESEPAFSGGNSKARVMALEITQETAEEIADRVFTEDFGEDFVAQSTRKTELEENFRITRSDSENSYTVEVFKDGSYERKY